VYTWFVYKSRRFELALRNALAARPFEIVHLDSLDLARYLPLLRALPVACTHHNVESMLLQRRASGEPRRVRRAYMSRQAALMQQQERRWCPRVALNVAVSRADLEALRRIAGGGEYLEVPNGVDTHYFRPETGREGGVVFVGGTTWYPNRDALDYFCEDILPHLRRALPSVRIRWVGRSSAAEQETFGRRYGVELSGYVADIRPFVSDAGCFVVPLRIGGGTRLKILNAWAMGKAVVSTSVGCEGLHAVDGENILIRDTAAAFADAVSTVLLDPALRTRLGTAGRATAEREYAWEVIGAPMLERYMALARGHRLVAPRPQPTP
jgi:glycosyltransferase involved in cell wall biosynthesis